MTANLRPEALRALADELKNVEAHLDRDGYSDLYAFVAQAETALRAIADRDASLAARGFAEGVEAAAKYCLEEAKDQAQLIAQYREEGDRTGALVHSAEAAEARRLAAGIRALTPPAGCEYKEVEARSIIRRCLRIALAAAKDARENDGPPAYWAARNVGSEIVKWFRAREPHAGEEDREDG